MGEKKSLNQKIFTSESVSEGHPDKVCDKISDAILDAYLTQDPTARVACETLATTNRIIVAGEICSDAMIDIEHIVRTTLRNIGYVDEAYGMSADLCEITNLLHTQSPDIAQGVDADNDGVIGAGDQGMMFGYAESGNEHYMPLPIIVAHELVARATRHRKSGAFKHARPDMKAQVTIDYNGEHPVINTVVMSVQHDEDFVAADFQAYLQTEIIEHVLQKFNIYQSNYQLFINPTGRFVIGGPHGDTGLTGRKIIVDTYGGYARHGGGAFSGKDPTKVDRTGAYMARYLAKNIVSAGLADKCEIQLSYAIGVAQPVSLLLETFGTEKVPFKKIRAVILDEIDLTPAGMIAHLDLRQPMYESVAAYGHFGRLDVQVPWERLDLVPALKKILL